jgi:endoglucanase
MTSFETIARLGRCKPARGLVGILGLIAALIVSVGVPADAGAKDAPLQLKRGVSIHTWLNWSPVTEAGDYRWPPYRSLDEWGGVRELERIKSLGFDFVRLTVDPGPLLSSDGSRREEAVGRIEDAVRAVLAADFKVIVDLHPVGQVKAWSASSIEGGPDAPMSVRYRSVAASLAGMLARVDTNKTALELMNEPQFYPCDGSGGREWQAVLVELVRAARAAAPDLTLVVSGACGGNITGLVHVDPAQLDDDRLIYSFHFYEPHSFTHQGLGDARDVKGVPWPADPSLNALVLTYSELKLDRENVPSRERSQRLAYVRQHLADYTAEGWGETQIAQRFGEVTTWAKENGIPNDRLLLGEFSVIVASDGGGALDADRFRWLSAVREETEKFGIPWAYWSDTDLMSPDKSRYDLIALDALQLTEPFAN